MTTVPFKVIPSNLRLPGAYFELDNSQANTAQQTQRALIIGQILSTGIATPNVPIISGGVGDAQLQGGAGSMLHLMTQTYRLNDAFGEVWYLPVSDAAGAAAAAGSVNFTAPPTAAGTISLYIAGTLVAVPVTVGQTGSSIATAVVAAINGSPTILPVTATIDGTTPSQVDITARNKGIAGNDIDIRMNYLGTKGGEVTPAGLAYTITPMANGALNPTLTTALGNLGTKTFDFIVNPYTDTASLNAVQQLLNDQTGRWSFTEQLYGHSFGALRGTFASLTTAGIARNNQHETLMGFYDSPTPNWLWAAALAAQAAVSVRADPGVPLQYLTLLGVLAPPVASQFLPSQRETLLFDGISTFLVISGAVEIEYAITTYQLNPQGVTDSSYLNVETMFQLMLEIRTLQSMLLSKFARCKLASNNTRPSANSGLVTPNTIAAEIVALYSERADAGFVQNAAQFAQQLVVQQNAVNPDRVDILWPGTLVDQMRTFSTLVQFRLS